MGFEDAWRNLMEFGDDPLYARGRDLIDTAARGAKDELARAAVEQADSFWEFVTGLHRVVRLKDAGPFRRGRACAVCRRARDADLSFHLQARVA